MKNRPLCSICLVIAVLIGILTIGAGAKFVKELRPSPIEKYGEEGDWLIVRGQVYQQEEKEKYQIIYLKNCSIYIQKDQKNQQSKKDHEGQISFVKESKIIIYDENKINIKPGNEVEANGKLEFFEMARNPGNFNQKDYYRRQNIHGKIWSESCKITNYNYNKIQDMLQNIRRCWKRVLLEQLGEEKGGILTAMILGEKAQMDPNTKKLYQVNGIGHILAISGLHLSVIGIGIYQLLRKATGSFSIGGVAGIFFFALYVLMIGFTVSVIRAGIMYLFRVGADIAGRHYDGITALAAAAAVVLLWRPLSIFDGAFWLSFLAVCAVLILIPPGQNIKSSQKKAIDIIKDNIKSNIEMQLFLLPIVLYYFYEFPLYAAFLNLLVIPLMSILLPLGITGSFICMLFSEILSISGKWMLKICDWILVVYEYICEWMIQFPGARVVVGRPELWQIFLFYECILFAWYVCIYNKKLGKKTGIYLVIVGLSVLLHRFESATQMQVAILDVGQGDGIFVKGPGRMTCMIDGGSTDIKQVGQYRIEPYLLSKGIGKLDYVFVSHGDNDHKNGIEEMLERQKVGVKIGTIVLPEEKVWDDSLKRLAKMAWKNGVSVAVIKAGEKIHDGDMEIVCLGPGDDYQGETGNAASMILLLSYRDFDFLFTGDVEGEGEELLCKTIQKYYLDKTIEVLKAAHHGSRNSSSETFLNLVRPGYTLISAGVENSYGHPHVETLERLEKIGSRIYNTANCGGIEITVEFGGKIQYTLKEGSETKAYEESE